MPIKIRSTGGGSVSIDVPNTGSDFTLTAPANNATLFTTSGGTISGNVAFTSNNVTIGGSAISPAVGMRNRIINGDMRIDQRATAITASGYSVDRWRFGKSNDATESVAQNSDAPTGFSYSLRNTISVADTSIAAAQFSAFLQTIEGYNIADLGFGTTDAKTITLSFWVKATQTGAYSAVLQGGTPARQVFKTFSVSASNTWEYKTLTFSGDTNTGSTWNSTNGIGLSVQFYFALGSSFLNGTDGVWAAASTNNFGPVGMSNALAANGNIYAITGVQLEVGSVATPFERRPFGLELQLCQRYYEDSGNAAYNVVGPYTYSTNQLIRVPVLYKVTKRSSCTLTINDDNGNANRIYRNGTNRTFSIWLNTPYVFSIANTDTPSGSTDDIAFRWTASAEL